MQKKEVMKIVLNSAWENFDEKEKLIDIVKSQKPDFSEEEALAFCKVYAYAQMAKSEDKPKWKHNLPREESGKINKLSWNHDKEKRSIEGEYKGKKFKVDNVNPLTPQDAAINASKKVAKSKAENINIDLKKPMNKSSHEKGVHKPFGGKDISQFGHATRGHWSFGNKEGNKKKNVREHEKVLGEMKEIKPNLPKSENMKKARVDEGKSKEDKIKNRKERSSDWADKENKGVNDNFLHNQAAKEHGVSDAGRNTRLATKYRDTAPNSARENRATAKRFHHETLSEAKKIKPNLPKSENMNKSKEEKGVHWSSGTKGQSMAGEHNQRGKKPSQNQEYHKLSTKDMHRKVLGEMKDIKPNLPKSENMNKSKEDFDFKKEHKSDKGGLTDKGREAYNKATGSDLKRPQPEGGKRKKSFCARNKGQLDMHNIDCKKTPEKRACKARKRWKC